MARSRPTAPVRASAGPLALGGAVALPANPPPRGASLPRPLGRPRRAHSRVVRHGVAKPPSKTPPPWGPFPPVGTSRPYRPLCSGLRPLRPRGDMSGSRGAMCRTRRDRPIAPRLCAHRAARPVALVTAVLVTAVLGIPAPLVLGVKAVPVVIPAPAVLARLVVAPAVLVSLVTVLRRSARLLAPFAPTEARPRRCRPGGVGARPVLGPVAQGVPEALAAPAVRGIPMILRNRVVEAGSVSCPTGRSWSSGSRCSPRVCSA
jgi:hypothetical protein